jgi:hypothetical protein
MASLLPSTSISPGSNVTPPTVEIHDLAQSLGELGFVDRSADLLASMESSPASHHSRSSLRSSEASSYLRSYHGVCPSFSTAPIAVCVLGVANHRERSQTSVVATALRRRTTERLRLGTQSQGVAP